MDSLSRTLLPPLFSAALSLASANFSPTHFIFRIFYSHSASVRVSFHCLVHKVAPLDWPLVPIFHGLSYSALYRRFSPDAYSLGAPSTDVPSTGALSPSVIL